MSGLIKRQFTINSGTTNVNLLAGEVFEFLQRPAAVRMLINQEIVMTSNIIIDFNLGNVIATQDFRPNIAVTAGVIDKSVDEIPAAVGTPPDRIQIRARETTAAGGANGILNLLLEIVDLA